MFSMMFSGSIIAAKTALAGVDLVAADSYF